MMPIFLFVEYSFDIGTFIIFQSVNYSEVSAGADGSSRSPSTLANIFSRTCLRGGGAKKELNKC